MKKIEFVGFDGNGYEVFFSDINGSASALQKVRIVPIQEAYINDDGTGYIASASGDDGKFYRILWNIKEVYYNFLGDITDESILCDWDCPTKIEEY